MKQIKCELCGSTDFVKEEGVFVCQYCGAKYSVEEAKKMMIEGTVDVSGSTVKVDTEADIANWYTIARRAKDSGDDKKAGQYYDMILQKRPDDWEATFYSAYFRASGASYADARSEVINLANNIPDVISLINNIEDEQKKKEALTELCFSVITLSAILTGAMGSFFKNNIESTDAALLAANGISAASSLVEFTASQVQGVFGISEEDYKSLYKALLIQAIEVNKGAVSQITSKVNTIPFAEKANKLQDQMKEIDDTYVKQEVKGNNCYVATCVYGSYDCPEVWTLRRYRDYELAETWYGRVFIHTYYAISPTIVKWFGHTEWFKRMWKGKLDRMVKDLQSKGYEDTPYEDRNW